MLKKFSKYLPQILATLFLAGFVVYAWQEPGQAPPGGNVEAPINVGPQAQTKQGDLTIDGALKVDGNIVVPVISPAADTGFKSPTANGGNSWSNPTYAYTSDNIYVATTGSFKEIYYNFFLNVPAGSVIKGIEVTVEASANSSNATFVSQLSWDGGITYTSTKQIAFSTTEQILTMGGALDTWNRTWNSNELSNANFRIRLGGDTPFYSFSVDHIQVKVYYAPVSVGVIYNAATGKIERARLPF